MTETECVCNEEDNAKEEYYAADPSQPELADAGFEVRAILLAGAMGIDGY